MCHCQTKKYTVEGNKFHLGKAVIPSRSNRVPMYFEERVHCCFNHYVKYARNWIKREKLLKIDYNKRLKTERDEGKTVNVCACSRVCNISPTVAA
jgi:hypothetical protein